MLGLKLIHDYNRDPRGFFYLQRLAEPALQLAYG